MSDLHHSETDRPRGLGIARWVSSLSPWQAALGLLLLVIVALLLVRLGLLWVYYEDFDHLGLGPTLWALFYGMRFDLAAAALLWAPGLWLLLWLLLWPLPWAHQGWWRFSLRGVALLGLLLILAVELGSLFYFGHVRRRPGAELFAVLRSGAGDVHFLTSMMSGRYLLGLGISLLLMCLVAWWAWILSGALRPSPLIKRRWQWLLVSLLVPLLLVVAVRGGLQRKAMGPADFFQGQDFHAGLLSGNSSYLLLGALRQQAGRIPDYMPRK
ncbi:MAG: hypothetical protein EA401_00310 [Planctomycetota bacterium]|nr:MAG: hypothetical protein EA401_00310 [Planctomycetota bacterium]